KRSISSVFSPPGCRFPLRRRRRSSPGDSRVIAGRGWRATRSLSLSPSTSAGCLLAVGFSFLLDLRRASKLQIGRPSQCVEACP
uniref:Uncharacterized protein n=1 Tax=Oryza meridionalis TaxID=40149 RepID=A0A0E0E0H0_9ORYZ